MTDMELVRVQVMNKNKDPDWITENEDGNQGGKGGGGGGGGGGKKKGGGGGGDDDGENKQKDNKPKAPALPVSFPLAPSVDFKLAGLGTLVTVQRFPGGCPLAVQSHSHPFGWQLPSLQTLVDMLSIKLSLYFG